jgi:pimeloyl-ACP methyl ester carboxylesterase
VASFVLVHGAWHGGWCWRRVADRLGARGHRVFAPTLTGVADRSHLLSETVGLDTHVMDVANLIKWEGLSDVVLVGHSYGGMVISGVAEKVPDGTIGSIVFLDAFVPEDGENLEGMTPARFADGPFVAPISAARFRVNDQDVAWVDAQCTPHPRRTMTDRIALTGARERIAKKAYIRAATYDGPAFRAFAARFAADPAWRVYDVPSGHDMMLDQPERLAEILEEVA